MIVMLAAACPLRKRARLRGPEPRLQPARPPRQHAASGGYDVIRTRTAKVRIQKARRRPRLSRRLQQLAKHAEAIAKGLGAQLIALETPNAGLNATQGGRSWNGQIYVATPQLLRAFGIKASQIDPECGRPELTPGPFRCLRA